LEAPGSYISIYSEPGPEVSTFCLKSSAWKHSSVYSARLAGLIAENLFLRKQLALFRKRKVKPCGISRSARLAALGKLFDWREALVVVKPETFINWHRNAFRTFWCWKSRKRGRPMLPKNLRELIREPAKGARAP
jgi:hypothetical protein